MPMFITNTKLQYKPKSFFHCTLPLRVKAVLLLVAAAHVMEDAAIYSVCVFVCLPPRLLITSGVMWCDIDPI